MTFSVITPAHNEDAFIERCIDSVKRAAVTSEVEYEHIIVLNRCSDRTEEKALSSGCRVVEEDARNLSVIRNAGARVAVNDVIVTIDADSWMSPTMFREVSEALQSNKYIGGGVRVRTERLSVGIVCSLLVALPFFFRHRVSAGMFWCRRSDFNALGGFDESLICVEDIDFAKRLKRLGLRSKKRYGTIRRAFITTSCRKFDQFGDWCFVRRPRLVLDIFRRREDAANEFYYDVRDTLGSKGTEQGGARQPASAVASKSEGNNRAKPASEGRSQ